MKKFEYVSESSKTCVVVLKDHWGNTLAKGMSRCSEDDTFSKEAGLKLANARAWKKYFDNTIKHCESDIKRCEVCAEYWNQEIDKTKRNLDVVKTKQAALEKELEELLASL